MFTTTKYSRHKRVRRVRSNGGGKQLSRAVTRGVTNNNQASVTNINMYSTYIAMSTSKGRSFVATNHKMIKYPIHFYLKILHTIKIR